MYIDLHAKYPSFLSYFNGTWIFWTDFWKNVQISSFIKISQVGAELFDAHRRMDGRTDKQADSHTDMKKLIVGFRSFVNALRKTGRIRTENVELYFVRIIRSKTIKLAGKSARVKKYEIQM
jgi:hypothetical protein